MKQLILSFIMLTGCTVNIIDKRLTREEVAQALQERDVALAMLKRQIEELSKDIKK